jgi:death-on-curing protein
MNEPRWINREDCILLHEMVLVRFGGTTGVRDPAQLDTTVAGVKERFAAGVDALGKLAACYCTGIIQNRPFMSGNLAAAFVIPAAFLGCNGLQFRGDAVSMVESILELAQAKTSEAEFAHYLRCNCDPPWHLEKRS